MGVILHGTLATTGNKVLRKSQRATEVDGLVTLTETYTIRTADIAAIEPEKGTLHSAFSSASTKYTRMSVETTRVEPLDGSLSSLVVNYVGLDYASGLPKAFVTAVGQPGVGVFGADAAIVVKYVTDQTLFDLLKGGNIQLQLGNSNLILPTKRLMPSSINGTQLPPNPRQREYRRSPNQFVYGVITTAGSTFSLGLSQGFQQTGAINQYPPLYEWLYAGYVQSSISFERRGQFNQIEEQFTEYIRATDQYYTTDGLLNYQKLDDPQFTSFQYSF
jgi:hypothetical protein